MKKLIHRKQSKEVRKMDENKHSPPDGQDQTGQEIKRINRRITLLWICVILLNIDYLILSNRIDRIIHCMELITRILAVLANFHS